MKIKNINVLPRLIKDIFLSDKKKFILAVLCVLFSGVGVVIAPFMLQNIIDGVITPALKDPTYEWLPLLISNILILISCYVVITRRKMTMVSIVVTL